VTKTVTIKYIIVNASSAYKLLLGRPFLNRLGAVASTAHMRMKLHSSKGGVITIKSDQKTRESATRVLKNRKGTYTITVQAREPEWIAEAKVANER